MIKRVVLTWLTKRLTLRILRQVNAHLDQNPEKRGTASQPLVLTTPYNPTVGTRAVDPVHVDHVHTSDGVCLKNRFGPRCTAPGQNTEEDWVYGGWK